MDHGVYDPAGRKGCCEAVQSMTKKMIALQRTMVANVEQQHTSTQ